MKLVIDNADKKTRPKKVEPVAKREKDPPPFCQHGGTMTIDPDTRLVQCGICDRWLDAFTALSVLTRRWHQQAEATKWAEYRLESVSEAVVKLKREERNIKARIRSAKKRLKKLE